MLWLDHKYANLLSPRLDRFKRKSSGLYNFRCPLCGDSNRYRSKARGYLFERSGSLVFHCHNCGATRAFRNLLRELDSMLHSEYLSELMVEDGRARRERPELFASSRPAFADRSIASGRDPVRSFERLVRLRPDHPARLYVAGRGVGEPHLSRLMYASRFMEAVNRVVPGKFGDDALRHDGPRVVVPYHTRSGELVGVTGRALDGDSIRYVSVPFVEGAPRVYGADLVDPTRDVLVLEGAFDAMLLPNAISVSGSSMTTELGHLPDVPKDRFVIIHDHEPRNRQVVAAMEKTIARGYRVVVWPDRVVGKDIGEMVENGLTPERVLDTIRSHTYVGPAAALALTAWRRC